MVILKTLFLFMQLTTVPTEYTVSMACYQLLLSCCFYIDVRHGVKYLNTFLKVFEIVMDILVIKGVLAQDILVTRHFVKTTETNQRLSPVCHIRR